MVIVLIFEEEVMTVIWVPGGKMRLQERSVLV